MSFFTALETSVQRVSSSGSIPLEVVLGSVALILAGVSLSSEVIALVVSLAAVISLSAVHPILVDVHGDRGVVHPSQGI